MSDTLALLQSWRQKSEHDLEACRQLLQAENPLEDVVAAEYVTLAKQSCMKIWSYVEGL